MLQKSISAAALSLVLLGAGACSPPPEPEAAPSLTGTVWQLQQIQYNDDTLLVAEPPESYTIEFLENGQVGVQADCNRVLGEFTTTDDSRLTITLGPSTLAACPPESIDTQFVEALSSAAIYFFQEGDLYIDLKYDSGTMQFSAPE